MVLHVRPLQGLSCNSIFSHPSANSAGTLSCKIWTRDPCKTNDATWTHLSQHNLTPFHGWVNVSGSVCETGQCCSLHQLGWELTLGDAKWFVQGHKTRREAGQVLCSGSRCCLFPMPVSRVREKKLLKVVLLLLLPPALGKAELKCMGLETHLPASGRAGEPWKDKENQHL